MTRPPALEFVATAIADATGRGVTLTRVYGANNRVATITDPLGGR